MCDRLFRTHADWPQIGELGLPTPTSILKLPCSVRTEGSKVTRLTSMPSAMADSEGKLT